ncbi:uncharacterized protein LOC134279234 [Saccostrea cucullata]|uniref:uncharacterized protein LOC134279234 n=1 Tax=Saccostrea cuccullata TaxID=36930 RepID=UPI002ED1CB79
MEIGRNRTNSIRSFPNLPLESVRNTESDSFVHHTGKGRWPKNVMQDQGPRIHLRHTSSWDNQSGTCRDEVQSPFQPIEKPSTHSESPTGLHKPPPIAFSKWSRLHGFPDAADKEIEGFFRPSLVKKVVRSQRGATNKSPEVRNALSTNSIYERDSNALWKKMFPNTSDTAMNRIQFSPSSVESSEEDFSSFCSSSDHTIVGRQSTTSDHTVTEERLAALNVNGGPTSSGSLRAPRCTRDSPTSSSGSLCTAQLVSRSQTSEEDNYYMPSQNNFYQNPYSNINKTGAFPGGSLSTNSLYESTVDGPIGSRTSTHNSNPVSVGRTSGTMSTQSSLYSVTNDVMMRKNSPSPMPNETNGYSDKIQKEANNQTKHFAKIGSYYKQCYDHGKVCDVRFCVDDDVLYAHKGALCSVSPYFETVFIENKQMNWKPMTEIRLRGLSILSLKAFLNFVYTGSFEVTSSTILDLVKISRQFQVPVIRQRCLTKLERLPQDDFVPLLMAVRKDPMNDFMSPILRCISEKFLEISQRSSFLEMDLDTLIVVLSHDELVTSSEMDVFCAAQGTRSVSRQ